jgi:hypothetical protein
MSGGLSDFSASVYCRCSSCCLSQSPTTVIVNGAGCQEVDGEYAKLGRLEENAAVYMRTGLRNGAKTDYYIMLSPMCSNEYSWYICCTTDGKVPSGPSDIDFYRVFESENLALFTFHL